MKELAITIKAAKIASVIIKKYYSKPDITAKGVRDVVTNADIEAENAIRKFLLKETDYGFIGEETGKKEGNPVWIVDPIDGTRAFCFGIPYFSTVIALMDNNETLAGVVYNPITEELYTAIKNKGAFMNGKRLFVKSERPIKESLVGCAFVYNRKELCKLEKSVNICLINFSCALDVCKTAAGRIDGAVYGLTRVVDHAAAALIAKEAGIEVTNFGTKTWNAYGLGVVAARPNLHRFLCKIFSKPLKNLDASEKFHVK